jgi:nicotinate-nucleotide adenylyltransferase
MASQRRIALFGGTFDPVHEGHLEIASKAIKKLDLESLVFIPCRQSPHKEKVPGASGPDRLKMLSLAVAAIPRAAVDNLEFRRPGPSYTWETVAAIRDEFPEPEKLKLFLLIGEDQWRKLPTWKNPRYLAEKVEFIVVGRGEQPEPREGYRAHFIRGNHPASSSEIRRQIHSGQQPDWLPEAVESYIAEKGLYSALP